MCRPSTAASQKGVAPHLTEFLQDDVHQAWRWQVSLWELGRSPDARKAHTCFVLCAHHRDKCRTPGGLTLIHADRRCLCLEQKEFDRVDQPASNLVLFIPRPSEEGHDVFSCILAAKIVTHSLSPACCCLMTKIRSSSFCRSQWVYSPDNW
jgi:hypothetical protein